MREARPDLYRAGVFRKYLLVVTDGENTSGRSPDEVAREIFRKSEGAVQIYFVAFDTSPEKFAFLKEVGGDVIGAGTGAELRQALDGIYQGKILAEALDAGEREPRQEVTTSYPSQRRSRDSSQVLVGVRGADQQDRQPLLGGRSDRADAVRVRPGRRAAQGRAASGLEQYRGLVERVTRQVATNQSHVAEARGARPRPT